MWKLKMFKTAGHRWSGQFFFSGRLYFFGFAHLWSHPRKDGAIQQQNQGRGDRATWIQSYPCQLVLFPCLAYWPAMRTCCFWGRFQLFFPKQCVHTMGFLQQGLGVKGRVWLRVRIVVCGFWPRSFAQKNPLRSSMFLSTVQNEGTSFLRSEGLLWAACCVRSWSY